MRKEAICLFFVFLLTYSLISEEKYFYKNYSNCIIVGGREKITFKNIDDKNSIEISLVKVDTEMFNSYSRIKINYIIKNKTKKNIEIKFLYPFLYSNISKKIEKTEKSKFLENRIEESVIKGLYSDFKIIENGIAKNYEIELTNIEELNLPYSIGNEKNIFEPDSLYSEKVISFVHRYGFYSINLNFNPKEKKIITISYTSLHYNSNIKSTFDYNNSIEDPSLRYMYKKVSNCFEMLSESLHLFMLYPSYIEETLVPKKMFIKIKPYLINNEYLKILPNKYSLKAENILFKYSNPNFKQYDNITVKILPINYKNSIPTFYFISTPEKEKRDKFDFFLFKKGEELIFEYIPDNNLSFLYKKDGEKIGIKEIRILPQIFTLKKSIKDTNLPLEFEISFSDNRDFENATIINQKISYKNYYNLLKTKKYITIYKGENIFCKFIKIKIKKSFYEDNEIIQINDILFIN